MAKSNNRPRTSNVTNTNHLVLSTGDPHPPFIQEVPGQPGVIERCEWDDSINGYRCAIVQASDA